MSKKIKLIGTISLLTLMFISVTCIGIAPMEAKAVGSITYLGVTRDVTDYSAQQFGPWYWFAQLDAPSQVSGRPTGERDKTNRPGWTKDLVHYPEQWDFANRTFSQDGPTRSKGGYTSWATITLPDGTTHLSGAIVDPYTIGNTNNTVNKIRLESGNGVPSPFYFHVVIDNTNQTHKTTRVRARGDDNGTSIEANTYPSGADLVYNGIPDVYTFRYDGFGNGDYQKLQLSADAGSDGASIAGFMWSTSFTPGTSFEPAD
jgi:hypothetical protein